MAHPFGPIDTVGPEIDTETREAAPASRLPGEGMTTSVFATDNNAGSVHMANHVSTSNPDDLGRFSVAKNAVGIGVGSSDSVVVSKRADDTAEAVRKITPDEGAKNE